MRKKTIICIGIIILLGWVGALLYLRYYSSSKDAVEYDLRLPGEFERLTPLFEKPGTPQPGDWLARYQERGQTYQEYLHSGIHKPAPPRNVIYVQPVGEFSPGRQKMIEIVADCFRAYFSLPVKLSDPLPLESVPESARRRRDPPQEDQLLTTYLLNDVLAPRKPDDAYIVMGIVAGDIWPGGNWNRVFGQANGHDRIAICSLAKICPDEIISKDPELALRRTLKTSTHEICHLFFMMHCTFYLCNAAGVNNVGEMDRHPLELCPQCMAKFCYATGADPAERTNNLKTFYKQNDLDEEEIFCDKILSAFE